MHFASRVGGISSDLGVCIVVTCPRSFYRQEDLISANGAKYHSCHLEWAHLGWWISTVWISTDKHGSLHNTYLSSHLVRWILPQCCLPQCCPLAWPWATEYIQCNKLCEGTYSWITWLGYVPFIARFKQELLSIYISKPFVFVALCLWT